MIAAAALANLKETLNSGVMKKIAQKEKLIRELLRHELILEVRGKGLMLALIYEKHNDSKSLW